LFFTGHKDNENFIPRQATDYHGERGFVLLHSGEILKMTKYGAFIVAFFYFFKSLEISY